MGAVINGWPGKVNKKTVRCKEGVDPTTFGLCG